MSPLRGQTAERSAQLLNGVILHATSLESARRAVGSYSQGDYAVDSPFMIVAPSGADRTLVPPGSDGHVLYLWGVCPFEPRQVSWDEHKPVLADEWISVCDDYAPGFKDAVVGFETQSRPTSSKSTVPRAISTTST